jgi:hypothetical protein
MFGEKTKEYSLPMVEKDHPELDLTPELDETGIKQSIIDRCITVVFTLGSFDIQSGVATKGSYRVVARCGHLDWLNRMYGYIKRHLDGAIGFRVRIPNHESQGVHIEYDWSQAVYSDIKEELPYYMLIPKGEMMRTATYKNANLMHDLVTGRLMSGVLRCLSQTPIQWLAKKQKYC